MQVPQVLKFQIGKSGLTKGVIDSLNLAFKNHRQVRVSVLKSAGRDRESIKSMAQKISESLQVRNAFKILGFTIIVKKLSNSKVKIKV